MPNRKTVLVEESRKRRGIKTKAIRIPKELDEKFIEACEHLGISQLSVFREAMEKTIQEAAKTSK